MEELIRIKDNVHNEDIIIPICNNMPSSFYGYVYLTINMINYRRYIGQSKCKKSRKGKYPITNDININETYIGSGVALGKAVKKYGKRNFIKFIIRYCKTKEELDFYEKFFISWYDAQRSFSFYNIAEGGGNYNNLEFNPRREEIISNWSKQRKGKKKSEDHKRKIGESHKGWVPTEENRINIGKATKGRPSPMKGKHHTEESRSIIKEKRKNQEPPMKGKHHSDETKKRLSEMNKGKPSPNKGKHLSDEAKQKLSEWNLTNSPVRGRKQSPEERKLHGDTIRRYWANKRKEKELAKLST